MRYRFAGLAVESDIRLDGLTPNDDRQEAADLFVTTGQVEISTDAQEVTPALLATDKEALVTTEFAQFLVRNGSEIIVDASDTLSQPEIQFIVLSEAMPILLHQRGFIPFHAATVLLDNGSCVAFVGQSGAGKSTLLAKLIDRDYKVISDDICIIDNAPDGTPYIQASSPRLKLLPDTLTLSGRAADDHGQIAGANSKYLVDMGDQFQDGRFPLHRLYLLEWPQTDEGILFSPIPAMERFQSILANIHYGRLPFAMGRDQQYMTGVSNMSSKVEAVRFCRPKSINSLDQTINALINHMHGPIDD